MLPLKHFLIGLIFSSLLLIIFPSIGLIPALLILASNSLIDSDHYLYYVFHKKNFSLKKAYDWFIKYGEKIAKIPKDKQNQFKEIILIFHGIEFWAVLILLSFIYPFLLWVLLGMAIHIYCDMIEEEKRERLFKSIVSILVYTRNKKKKELKIK